MRLVFLLLLTACSPIEPAHRAALTTMVPISDPLAELLMRSEIPHHEQTGTAPDLGSERKLVKGLSLGTK